jgi:co-chaperonin GroES (HSP10)
MKTIRPAHNIVFCERVKPEESTQSGIIIPPSALSETQLATVIESGSNQFNKGDTVVYKEYTTTDVVLDEKPYFLIDAVDVLGTIQDA